jgi:hypothetical protein
MSCFCNKPLCTTQGPLTVDCSHASMGKMRLSLHQGLDPAMCPQIRVSCCGVIGTWIMEEVKVMCSCSTCSRMPPEVGQHSWLFHHIHFACTASS